MKKTILMILITFFIGTQKSLAQEKLTENQKLETLCKVWGFLKYYHPIVAKGIYNWDNQLIEKIKESEKIDTKKQFNKLLSSWIENLGKVEICNTCKTQNDKKYFLKNFDLSWTDDEKVFTKDVIEKLNFIEKNRNLGENYYLDVKNKLISFKHETINPASNLEKETKLYELFNYWNKIEYFFPYKYQTDENWNSVLKVMIPKFIEAKNEKEYWLTFLELVSKTDDSHVVLISDIYQKYLFGKRRIPVEYKLAEDKLVITKIISNKNNIESNLKVGDVIIEINQLSVPKIIEKFGKYVPSSNEWTKIRKLKPLLLNSEKENIALKINRNDTIMNIDAKTFETKDINFSKKDTLQIWKFLDQENTIGYVNISALTNENLEEMYQNLKDTKAIIFDVRAYPNGTTRKLGKTILPITTTYYAWQYSEAKYPGKFQSENAEIGEKNKNYYQGKIIGLINETTQSQAETLTMMLKQHPNSKIIGSNSAGANGNVIKFKILNVETRFTGLGAFYPDGRETQRIGIVPDIEVKPTIKGIKEGRDEVLERALEYIKTGK